MAGRLGKRQLQFGGVSTGVKFQLEGRWRAMNTAMGMLGPDIMMAYMSTQLEIAEKLLKIIKGHIYNQDLGWVPLADSTQKRKGHDNAYIDTGLLNNSITILTRGTRVTVGIPRNIQAKDGVYLADIASMMEYGAGKMPARPLWGPSRDEMDRKTVTKIFATRLGGILLRHGITPAIR